MAHPRFDGLEPERQERILSAAAVEFAERGYGGASVNRIAEGAGLSKGVLYYYFEDKRDLFLTALERSMERVLETVGLERGVEEVERWLGSLPVEGFWEALRGLGHGQTEVIRSPAWYARLMRAVPRLREEPEARGSMERVIDEGRRLVRALVRRGQEVGLVRRDVPEGLLVECVVALDEAADRWVVERLDEVGERELQELVDARTGLIRDLLDARHEGWER